jgi:hypothetical protein
LGRGGLRFEPRRPALLEDSVLLLLREADLDRTDTVMHLRPAHWYRTRLARDFERVGGGLWAARRGPARLHALERTGRGR